MRISYYRSTGGVPVLTKDLKRPQAPSNSLLTFESGSFAVVLCCLFFDVRDLVTVHLTCVHIVLVQFRLLSGHLLGNSCSLG